MEKYTYIVDGGKYHRPKFNTLEEAAAAAHDHYLKTKEILAITKHIERKQKNV